ncbi:amylo-alpha-1,6-glucosidase [Nocardia goodfellowii]|uniref:Glycogen debranching enzyme n=1 Tax=Nocardia goodfellowii TaxID=882446 RepID=A0ABS4QP82_9NOCA|nr:glycogen debranching N-terminal domain-containing protein [Nocardia goodfellowii]MBP2193521.1 glycogen debranching enzyme [Nocardia goodfellowii]
MVNNPWGDAAGEVGEPSVVGAGVTLVEGSTFCISESGGVINPTRPEGLFVRDTRVVSYWRLTVDGLPPQPLTVQYADPYSATLLARTPPRPGRADSTALVVLGRHVGDGMREDLTVRNLSGDPITCTVALELDADFADLFEVKEGRIGEGVVTQHRVVDAGAFEISRPDLKLAVIVAGSGATATERELRWQVMLPARGEWSACIQYQPALDSVPVTPRYGCGSPVSHSAPYQRLRDWYSNSPTVLTEDETLAAVLQRAVGDLGALRIFDPGHPERAVVAAGAPWFMALFGRDSLLTSWMVLPLDRQLAVGTLQSLAGMQGSEIRPLQEEEPGRIPHEVRFGRAATLLLGGDTVYYGTADATPLFVMLLGELHRWGLDAKTRDELLPHADRALAWIEQYGDMDGDGFVEYSRAAEHGLANQGWKDSWDGVNFIDGSMPHAPIALAEVQGYVYAAYLARADLAADTGEHDLAAELRVKAARLKTAFNEQFWLPERGWFAIGLDRDKRPIDALTSNMGHCLWTGIIDDDKAQAVADHLLSPEMFTGWGIRTLGSNMGAYNPVSYHNGSVWPHDNAICAAGLMRYGFAEHANRIVDGVLDAAVRFGHRLPELFCGFDRSEFASPVPYPTSCSPQAWASATPLLFLRTMLRLEPGSGEHVVDPVVPQRYLPLRVSGLRVGDDVLTVTVNDAGFRVHGLSQDGDRTGR